MSKSNPQEDTFKFTQKLDKANSCLLIITILLPLLSFTDGMFSSLISLLNFLVMITFSIVTYLITYKMLPKSESIRRSDFFENTFGIPTTQIQSIEYFTNNNVRKGYYKMAVNLFENCFFTFNVSKEMLSKSTFKSLIFIALLAIYAYFGFINSIWWIAILQAFLSTIILGGTIKLFLYNNHVKQVLDNLENLFSQNNIKQNNIKKKIDEFSPHIVKLYVSYESNISWGGLLLDSNIFNKLNPKLSKEWEDIKNKYHIKA